MEEELVSNGEKGKRRLENHRVIRARRDFGRFNLLLKVGCAPRSSQGPRGFMPLLLTASEERDCTALPGT